MVKVPDALSLAAMRHVSSVLGRRVGGSTGTNFVGVLLAAQAMRAAEAMIASAPGKPAAK